MTSRHLAAINRRTRVLKLLESPLRQREIGAAEGISGSQVSWIGARYGKRRSSGTRWVKNA